MTEIVYSNLSNLLELSDFCYNLKWLIYSCFFDWLIYAYTISPVRKGNFNVSNICYKYTFARRFIWCCVIHATNSNASICSCFLISYYKFSTISPVIKELVFQLFQTHVIKILFWDNSNSSTRFMLWFKLAAIFDVQKMKICIHP